MTNKRYVAGRNVENLIKKKLKAQGYFVQRAAGSKGVADLLAIKRLDLDLFITNMDSFAYDGHPVYVHDALMVSCKKAQKMKPEERIALITAAARYGARPLMTKKIDGEWHLVVVV